MKSQREQMSDMEARLVLMLDFWPDEWGKRARGASYPQQRRTGQTNQRFKITERKLQIQRRVRGLPDLCSDGWLKACRGLLLKPLMY